MEHLTSASGTEPHGAAAPKMNPTIKARWVAALRSGKYRQGMGELRAANDCFCCLGVLCDLQGREGWDRDDADDDITPWSYREEMAFDLPPSSLKGEVGFDWHNTRVVINGRYETLYDHNDMGRTFAEIADAIEEQL